jgi:hypothetical protein
MLKITTGQCGMCAHFGETTGHQEQLVQIRIRGEAPEDLVEPCGHPNNRVVDLHVTPVSGCAGFTPAQAA